MISQLLARIYRNEDVEITLEKCAVLESVKLRVGVVFARKPRKFSFDLNEFLYFRILERIPRQQH